MVARKTFLSAMLVALLIAGVAGEAGLLWRARQRANKALSTLEQKKQALEELAQQAPAPTPENGALTAQEVSFARRRLEQLQRELTFRAESERAGPMPERPMDGFFALQKLGDDLRKQAQATGLGLRPEERFGFESHVREGPAVELLPAVHRQAVEVNHLVGQLLAAHPAALLSVRRESPGLGDRAETPHQAADFFMPAPGRLVRQAGVVESDALRVEFTGRTLVLREFMQALATVEQPFLVRAVEVEPVSAVAGIVPTEVKFTVLVEVPRVAATKDDSR